LTERKLTILCEGLETSVLIRDYLCVSVFWKKLFTAASHAPLRSRG